ncbi:neural cell adhesion molecule 1-like [Cyprinus carpio]|uniref:Neural cell adhesion molecule 1-like n=1 Tax=Cyprinus carpio TaxID=7962 RepID=A0A9Q9ZNI4_CYPCA|nr:neural cell adhesion molecule 1-like [Cyprinus carpio]
MVGNDARVSSLTLKYVQFTDAGQYLCTARNSIGQDIQSMYLEVRYVPSAPSIERVEPYSSTAKVEFDEPASSGGVPILKYKAEWRIAGQDWTDKEYIAGDGLNFITIVGLKPETTYEVKISAINGKGAGESSPPESFKTQPVLSSETPTSIPPTTADLSEYADCVQCRLPLFIRLLHVCSLTAGGLSTGNEMKVHWIKQDDGGSPIKHYLVRYRAKMKMSIVSLVRLPNGSEYVVLRGLEWNTEYEVYVIAENQRGRSDPGKLSFRTLPEPTAIPEESKMHTGLKQHEETSSGLGTGAIVGILIVVFILLLFGVDVTCYFLNKCGLLMCIAVNFCGKSGPSAKGKDIEEGKAAFTKDESKEPIVEVRTEEEHTPNHEGGGPTEPNETTPLTDPEHAADTTATVVDLLPSVTTNSDPGTDSPASDSTTLTSSTAPAANPKVVPKATPQSSTPKPSVTSSTSPQAAPAAVAPLVDLSDTPSNQTSKSLDAPQPSDSTTADLAKADGQSPAELANAPQSKDSQVQGGAHQTTDSDLAKDALGKPSSDSSSALSAPNQDEYGHL